MSVKRCPQHPLCRAEGSEGNVNLLALLKNTGEEVVLAVAASNSMTLVTYNTCGNELQVVDHSVVSTTLVATTLHAMNSVPTCSTAAHNLQLGQNLHSIKCIFEL